MRQHQHLTFPLLSQRERAGNPETTMVLLIEGYVGVNWLLHSHRLQLGSQASVVSDLCPRDLELQGLTGARSYIMFSLTPWRS